MTRAPFSIGADLLLEPHGLTVDGKAVARLDGCVFFLDHALPGQEVRARITRLAARYAEAQTLEVLHPAPGQAAPFCPFFGRCGGCDWQDLPLPEQWRWKRQFLLDALGRIARAPDPNVAEVIASPADRRFRNKMEFAFGPDGAGRLQLGLRRRLSREIVAVDDCPIAPEPAGSVLAAARRHAAQGSPEPFWRFLVLRFAASPEAGPQLHVQLITHPAPGPDQGKARGLAFLEALMADVPEITGASHSLRRHAAEVAYGERTLSRLGRSTLLDQVGPLRLEVDPDAFFQTNTGAATLLYEEIFRLAGGGPQVVWDLYSGVGGIALTLAPQALSVTGFELSKTACQAAQANARRNGLENCRFLGGDVAQTLRTARGVPGLLVVDPPRAGLHREVTALLTQIAPPRIIHVGCDPASQARDIGRLTQAGYRLAQVRAVDMFPHAAHIESIALLQRES